MNDELNNLTQKALLRVGIIPADLQRERAAFLKKHPQYRKRNNGIFLLPYGAHALNAEYRRLFPEGNYIKLTLPVPPQFDDENER